MIWVEVVPCELCDKEIHWSLRGESLVNARTLSRSFGDAPPKWRFILAGWTSIKSPQIWLCPHCAVAPDRERRIAMLALSDEPRKSLMEPPPRPPRYVLLHALAVVLRWLRKGWEW